METTEPIHRLLPARFRQPVFLLWLWVVPQLLLLFLNGRAGWLAVGEMTLPQKIQAGWIAGYEIGLLLLGIGVTLALRALKRPLGALGCVFGLVAHIGYLWLFLTRFDQAWPAAVAPWMLPQTELIYYQFASIMPALFYFAIRLACGDLPFSRARDTAVSLLAFVAVPALWFLVFQLARLAIFRRTSHLFPEVLAVVFFVVSTVLVLMAFLRLMLLLYGWLQERAWSRFALPLAAGLLAPIGGLLLNRSIPFPCDFQSPGVYVLTVLNGVVLLLPSPVSPTRAAWLWLARSVLFAFSLYFFVVFLPFLPLSLLAMLACGAGFLILAPTLLFVIHTRQLLAEGAVLALRWGRALTISAFVLCLLLIPLGLTLRALADKAALQQAMTVAFSPDLSADEAGLNRPATQRALEHLRDMKDGIYLPFLSDYYNHLVFNGMVLPDDKMQLLHRMFFGADAPKPGKRGQWSLFMAPRSRAGGWGGGRRIEPARQVQLQEVTVAEASTNGLVRAVVTLVLKNDGPANSEFVTEITLPDGVLVSGYWLDVAGQRKPGHIVEKKTAQWVYHMIRDFTRRDPGLLVFKDETRLKLNVYPFDAGETRVTGIEFLFPRGLLPRLGVGTREVVLGAPEEAPLDQPLVAASPDGRVHLILTGSVAQQLPTVTREPYLHFIVDRSCAAAKTVPRIADRSHPRPKTTPDLAARLASLAELAPGATGACRITFANYEWRDACPDPAPLAMALARAEAVPLPCRGGFCYDRAMAHALLQAQEEGGGVASNGVLRVPIFVVVPELHSAPLRTMDLAPFRRFVPDVAAYYLATDGDLLRIPFGEGSTQTVARIEAPQPVVVFQSDRRLAACLPSDPVSVLSLQGTASSLRVFEPSARAFLPMPPLRALPESPYTEGLALWEDYRATVWAPDTLDARLKELVTRSRATGILTPSTAYMVVENTAQEKTLALKEKQALGSHHALDFEETPPVQNMPEPGTFWLLPVALLLLFASRYSAWRQGRLQDGRHPCDRRP